MVFIHVYSCHYIQQNKRVTAPGSMGGDRIESAKKAVLEFLDSLPADCCFNIVSFGSGYSALYQRSEVRGQRSGNSGIASEKTCTVVVV